MSYASTCHCGAIGATIEGEMPAKAIGCNCSMCRRKGSLLHFVPAAEASIDAPADKLGDYRFNKHAIHHLFCATCGIQPFARGTNPKDGAEMVAINARTLDGVEPDSLTVHKVDGRSI